jgi:hypothetical protein
MSEGDQDSGVTGTFGDRDDPRLSRLTGGPQVPTDLDQDRTAVPLAEY